MKKNARKRLHREIAAYLAFTDLLAELNIIPVYVLEWVESPITARIKRYC